MTIERFARTTSKVGKSTRGQSDVEHTPISIRSSIPLAPGFEDRIRRKLANHVGYGAGVIERGTVRFEDVNGPKGGRDTVCRIKLVISGLPSIVVEKRDVSPARSFALTVQAIGTDFRRYKGRHHLHGRARSSKPEQHVTRAMRVEADAGELVGRRVGRGPAALARALERPEKLDRAAYVDTAATDVSASDRRAGGHSTARRNTRARARRALSTLEDSRKRPSRKSTRRSVNRGKPSSRLERAAAAATTTPRARASSAIANR